MQRIDVPVLVVGAGPVGLMASLLLAERRIESIVVDRREGPHRAPQAHVINPRTLEICRAAGLDMEELRAHATPRADGSHVSWVTTLAGEELGRLPYERQGDENLVYTPTPLLNLPQHRFEPLLLARLRREERADVRYRHEWESLTQDSGGVTSRIRDLSSEERYEVRSRYVLAADGAGSRVRRALDVEMIGPDQIQSFVMIHFEANLRALVKDRPAILYWTLDPECNGAFVAHDIERTWVFMHPIEPDADPRAFSVPVCEQIVRRAIGRTDVDFVVRDISPWTMTAQVAARYSVGRVFLVGDSAHRFPPSGGLGMNTGIQDAHNLAWKLAAVESGTASTSLLDTYESERRPVAQTNADQSVNNAMRMFEVYEALGISLDRSIAQPPIMETLGKPGVRAQVGDAIANQQEHFDMFGLQLGFRYDSGAIVADGTPPPPHGNSIRDLVTTTRPGARVPHAWVERAGERVSILDLVRYDRFTLITGRDGAAWDDAVAHVKDVRLECLVAGRDFADPHGAWAAVCEIEDGGALLVRPDQHVAWRMREAPADCRAALKDAIDAILV